MCWYRDEIVCHPVHLSWDKDKKKRLRVYRSYGQKCHQICWPITNQIKAYWFHKSFKFDYSGTFQRMSSERMPNGAFEWSNTDSCGFQEHWNLNDFIIRSFAESVRGKVTFEILCSSFNFCTDHDDQCRLNHLAPYPTGNEVGEAILRAILW